MNRLIISFAAVLVLSTAFSPVAHAQFKKDAFTQTYNDPADSLASADTTDRLVDFKEIFGGLAHKRKMRIGTMTFTGMFIPGAPQIYNEQYWKLPIVYGGIAGGVTSAILCNQKYQTTGDDRYRTGRVWSIIGAGAFLYASLMDGAITFKSDRKPLPGRATVYSMLLPGLGQAYNGEYWKIPIYVGGLLGSTHFLVKNNTNYIRYRNIYRETAQSGYSGPIDATQAKYLRDEYRRYRDYSIVAVVAFYVLQIIDANVFSYMNDFEVNDDLMVRVSPSVIMPDSHAYAMTAKPQSPAAGLSFALRF